MMASSSSPSPSEGGDGEGGDGGDGGVLEGSVDHGGRRRRGDGDPSTSRRRSADAVWPEHFVEAVATRVALDAASEGGRLAAAPALATFFQVCSTWRAVSWSELIWQELTTRVWHRHWHRRRRRRGVPHLPSWRDEFIRSHRTGRNFRTRRLAHSHVLPTSHALPSCRHLALSDHHLAAGFTDGSVRLFLLPCTQRIATYGPLPGRDRLGPFSQSVSGLFFILSDHLVYASHDGDVHVAVIPGSSRRAYEGNLAEDGTLVDFAGDEQRWVGLYAGVPGRSWRVWDGETEQLLYVGGSLTESESVAGWHLLTDLRETALGRVRIAEPGGTMVACTSSRIQAVELDDPGYVVSDLELRRGAIVSCMDACDGRVMVVDRRGMAKVFQANDLGNEVCGFSTLRRGRGGLQMHQEGGGAALVTAGCLNWGFAVVCNFGGVIRVWDVSTGEYLYSLRERVGEATAVSANDRYMVVWARGTGLHLWDFGA